MTARANKGVAAGRLEEVKVGRAVLGYLTKPRGGRGKQLRGFSRVKALQRKNELRRLVLYRLRNGLELSGQLIWAHVLSDLAAALGMVLNGDTLARLATVIGVPDIAPGGISKLIAESAAELYEVKRRRAGDVYRLLPARHIGELLEVTSVEREECKLLGIDAYDEDKEDRERRFDRTRKAQWRRGAGAVPRHQSKTAIKPWAALGISKASYYRKGLHRS